MTNFLPDRCDALRTTQIIIMCPEKILLKSKKIDVSKIEVMHSNASLVSKPTNTYP